FLSSSCARRGLQSFPTRRSSDLRRADVRIISSVVGALLGFLGLAISQWNWAGLTRLSTGSAVASGLGAIALLLAFDLAPRVAPSDRKSTRLNSSHVKISYAVFCL